MLLVFSCPEILGQSQVTRYCDPDFSGHVVGYGAGRREYLFMLCSLVRFEARTEGGGLLIDVVILTTIPGAMSTDIIYCCLIYNLAA